MANFDVNAWESLTLVRRLKAINENAWYDIRQEINQVAPLLVWRPYGLEEYTDHDLNHCYRIALALGNILPCDFELNEHELEILLYSIIFHDLGMWTKKCETEAALQNEDFIAYFKQNTEYDMIIKLFYSNIKEEKYAGELLLRQIVAQYNRIHHAKRTQQLLEHFSADFPIFKRISDEYLKVIGIICAAHDWSSEDVLKSELLDEYRLISSDYSEENDSDLVIDVRLITFLLRIGDLLDLDSRRISRIVWNYLDKLSVDSEAHWRKHECLCFKKLNKDEIIISGDFNYDRYGQVAIEAYHLAKQWCEYLYNEIFTLQKAMRNPKRYAMKDERKLGDLFLDISGVKGTGIIFADNLSFDMNKSRIIEILGDEIYEDKSSFIRELIQNAIDATRTQIVEDYKNGKIKSNLRLDLRSPNCWPCEITARPEYAISITTGTKVKNINNQDISLSFFEVSDCGIGMTVEQIKKYFLQIGKSYYKSNEFKMKYKHSSISRFGIGFLSCLLVGTFIEVETRSREDSIGVKLTMNNSTDIVSIVTEEKANYGTTVRVLFDSDIVEENGWLPIDQIDKDLMNYTHPDLFNSGKLLQAIYYWIPWSEMLIFINNQQLVSKSPIEIKSNNQFWAFPYNVIAAEDDEVLAVGSMIFKKNTMIPRFNDRDDIEDHFLPSIGGVTIPPWNKAINASSYIDIYRQPTSIITASRRAKFEIPSDKVKKEIIKQVLLNIDRSFENESCFKSNLCRALFRASICIDIDGIDLLLPVIRDGHLNWEEWDKRRFSTETCALVPFFIPVENSDIKFPIPIVGVPRRKPESPRSVIPKIENVRAININSKFTAALSMPNSWFQYDEIDNKYTYLLYRFVKYNNASDTWLIVNDDIATQEPIRQQMTDWDKNSGNIWKSFGFDPYERSCWSYAIGHYGSIDALNVESNNINIRIPRREWNLLEKPSNIDPLFKAVLRSLQKDQE